MGRPAKSATLHQLHGTKDHSDKAASAFVAGRPKIPNHLCKAARAEFKRACHILERRHVLTEGEATTLTLYAEVYARWIQAKREIGDELLIVVTVTDNNGIAHTTRRLNPLLKVVSDCESRLLALAKSLGLTPVDRERSKQTAVNPVEEIVPGSALDTNPELFSNVVPMKLHVKVEPSEMLASDEEETTDGNEAMD